MVRDREGNLSVDLISQITEYGKGRCKFVILEGIFVKQRYEEMSHYLLRIYDGMPISIILIYLLRKQFNAIIRALKQVYLGKILYVPDGVQKIILI